MEEFFGWLVRRFGQAVFDWTVQQLYERLTADPVEMPHICSDQCPVHCPRPGIEFDEDELGIDPEAEGWHD